MKYHIWSHNYRQVHTTDFRTGLSGQGQELIEISWSTPRTSTRSHQQSGIPVLSIVWCHMVVIETNWELQLSARPVLDRRQAQCRIRIETQITVPRACVNTRPGLGYLGSQKTDSGVFILVLLEKMHCACKECITFTCRNQSWPEVNTHDSYNEQYDYDSRSKHIMYDSTSTTIYAQTPVSMMPYHDNKNLWTCHLGGYHY